MLFMSETFLDITVLPYRSLSRKGFRNLMLVVATIFFTIGVFFWYIGAWPVFGFLGLDVVLLYYAFKMNYKSGEVFENLRLLKKKFLITRSFPSGTKQSWSLEPYWAKVEIMSSGTNQYNLIVRSKEKAVMIGSFLNEHDKKKLMLRLQDALNNYKQRNRV